MLGPIHTRRAGRRVAAAAAGLALAFAAPTARAQGLLDRSPNLAGGWIGSPGVLQFNFMHRFAVSDAPQRKVTNTPTFTLAAGLPGSVLAGVNYASNSRVAARYPNEWELFGRVLPLAERDGAPLDAAVQAGYNVAAASFDGELAVARALGPVRLIAAGRAFSDGYHEGESRLAAAAGAAIRLTRHLALGGDVASLIDRREGEKIAWSAGVQLQIPYTPHTLSLHASNVTTTTLQGASRGSGDVFYGFEFTVPITLRRYLPSRPEPVAAEPRAVAAPTDTTPAAAAARAPARRDSTPEPASDTTRAPAGARPAAAAGAEKPAPVPADEVSKAAAEPPAAERGRKAPATPAPRPARRAAPKEVVISINGLKFGEGRIEIEAGTTVVWKNDDPVPHTATADDGAFDSGTIEPGARWSHTFDRPGTYGYSCTPHPFMTGVIVVEGGGK